MTDLTTRVTCLSGVSYFFICFSSVISPCGDSLPLPQLRIPLKFIEFTILLERMTENPTLLTETTLPGHFYSYLESLPLQSL